MIDAPMTLEDAKSKRYGQWGGNPKGRAYNDKKCAYETAGDGWVHAQCSRKNGHGPGGLYCNQHAKMVEGR